MRKQLFKLTAAVAGLAIGAAPIAIYISTFGSTISSDHQRWAEMGSAMAGIYAPMLSTITALLLYNQLRLQKAQHKVQMQLATHATQQNIVSVRTEQLAEHLTRLENGLKGVSPLEKLLENGLQIFYNKDDEVLEELRQEARALYHQSHLLDSWVGIYSALEGLQEYPDTVIRALHSVLCLRVVASLSAPVVEALDNWHYAMGRRDLPYISRSHQRSDNAD